MKTIGIFLAFSLVCLIHFLVWYFVLATWVCGAEGAREGATVMTSALIAVSGVSYGAREFVGK